MNSSELLLLIMLIGIIITILYLIFSSEEPVNKEAVKKTKEQFYQYQKRQEEEWKRQKETRRQEQRRQEERRRWEEEQRSHSTSPEARYHEILGTKPGMIFTEIKTLYYQRVKENHPDNVRHLDKDFQKLAERKMKAINEAFSYFQKKHQEEKRRRQEEQRRQQEQQRRQEEERRRREEQQRSQEQQQSSSTSPEARYHEILGTTPGMSFAEIKKAYHQRVMEYHPDRVSHLGKDLQELAAQKMKAINEAYSYFEKKFGA